MSNLAPTAKLRWVMRTRNPKDPKIIRESNRILQQWWAPNVPDFMRRTGEGEWRDVEVADE